MRHQTTRQHVVLVRGGRTTAVLGALFACVATIGAAPVGADTSHTATATRSGTSRSAAGVAIDRGIAREAALRPSDFPAGWTSSPAPVQTMNGSCPTTAKATAAVSARANSRNFTLGSVATALSTTYVYADTPTAIHWFAQLTDRATTACLVHVLRETVGFQAAAAGATLDSVTSRRLIIEPVGDEHAAHVLIVRVSDGPIKATAYADVIFVRVGRSVAEFALARVGRIFDTALENKLATGVVGRLRSSLARAG